LTAAIKRLNQRLTMTDATLTLDGFAIAMDRILGLRHATSRRNLIAQETLYRCLHLVELSSSPEQDFEVLERHTVKVAKLLGRKEATIVCRQNINQISPPGRSTSVKFDKTIVHTFPMMTTTRKQVPYYAYYATHAISTSTVSTTAVGQRDRLDTLACFGALPLSAVCIRGSENLSARVPCSEWDRYTHQVRTLITVVCKVSHHRARSNNSRSLVPDHEAISSVSANYTTKSARLMEEIGGDERTHQLRT
ncbi:hypothetical protein KCU99_g412, partial [Aureobasidium melanogenum]